MPQDKPAVSPSDPAATANDSAEASPAPAAEPRRFTAFDATPIFRVVEVTRDARGRLRHEGRIWHTDLGRLRKFGRAVAANTASHRVMVADASGNVLEDIPIAPADDRAVKWTDWEAIALPPLPSRANRPAPIQRKPAPPPPSAPIPTTLGLEASVAQALKGAAATATAAVEAQRETPPGQAAAEPGSDARGTGNAQGAGADVELP